MMLKGGSFWRGGAPVIDWSLFVKGLSSLASGITIWDAFSGKGSNNPKYDITESDSIK